MIRNLILIALLLAVSCPSFGHAQESAWTVMVLNPDTGDLVRVDLAGHQITYDLGLDDNTFATDGRIALSADGNRVAFCAFRYDDGGGQFSLMVRDLAADALLLSQVLPNARSCSISPVSLSGDEVALGLIHYYASDEAPDDTTPLWEVRIVNILTGATVQSLGADSPALTPLELISQVSSLVVQQFSAEQVTFAQLYYAYDLPTEVPALVWNRLTDEVSVAPLWGKYSVQGHDITQEMIWAEHDPNRAAGRSWAMNVVQVRDPDGTVRTIYHTPDWNIREVKFIDGGARVAIHLQAPYDSEEALQNFPYNRWVALDRGGAVTELMEASPIYSELVAAPDGYVLLAFAYHGDSHQPITGLFYRTTNDTVTSLWQTDVEYWTVVWSAPLPDVETVGAFASVEG